MLIDPLNELKKFKKKEISTNDLEREENNDIKSIIEYLSNTVENIEKTSKKGVMKNESLFNEIKDRFDEIQRENKDKDKVIKAIIFILDRFDNVLEYALKAKNEEMYNSLKEVDNEIIKELEKSKFSIIGKTGDDFDEKIHQCVAVENNDEFKRGKIIKVIKRGYIFDGKIVRYSEVTVSK